MNKASVNSADQNLKYSEIKEVFESFDKDNDGFILIKEMVTIMRCLGQAVSEVELNEYYKTFDKDDKGRIEFSDFFHVVQQKLKEAPNEEDLIDAFKVSDKENAGTISGDDLAHALGTSGEKLNKEEIEELVRMADIRGDGLINYEEFVRMMMSK